MSITSCCAEGGFDSKFPSRPGHVETHGLLGDVKPAIWTRPTPSISDKITLLKTWFDQCESSHGACTPVVSILPKRLVTTGVSDGPIRLVRTAKFTQKAVRYATLSHCWGDKLPLRTTSGNEAMLEKGIPESMLPRTFRDAIELACRIDIPYLWIDALCIRQDDPVEWAQEAAMMKDIYAGSVLTIAAANGRCSDDGCLTAMAPDDSFRPVGPFRDINFTVKVSHGHSLHIRAHNGDTRSLTRETALSSRGWVLQEDVLSRRIVYCMLPELHWRCQCCYQIESGAAFDLRNNNNVLPSVPGRPQASLHDVWYQWMANYSGREFTFTKDRLSAMAGIVEFFTSISGYRHILGCWENSFAQGLLWLPLSRKPPNVGIPGIPSWSWLTRHDDVSYDHWTSRDKNAVHEYHVKLLDWNVLWTGTPFVSGIKAAQVQVRGPVQDIVLSVAPEGRDFNPPKMNVGDEVPDFEKGPIPWCCTGRIDHGSGAKQSYTCLLVLSSGSPTPYQEVALLLEPVISNDSTGTTYRRVGIAKFLIKETRFPDKSPRNIILV
ncbi:hypothetical protein PFICI_00786 [Pestalotiopsis fici W106-1]|uniref:Heterokaryon incompatibility domain-containing protein n=1 Tax=Pestalotiopsis fici (strain W106-1 / CGMCC3.15140) TaxID=1229662 RepID=W3XLL5_PESFW|nr:uncharacterized protein PFICI_00786 [Pestalotiopsis fici W106-1]ETS86958.1 hypothetical protein PFICI_00786 [Pestalotiopsis fici W106-1]